MNDAEIPLGDVVFVRKDYGFTGHAEGPGDANGRLQIDPLLPLLKLAKSFRIALGGGGRTPQTP